MDTQLKTNDPYRTMRNIFKVVIFLALAFAAVFLVSGNLNGLAHQPGFLGTHAHLYSDINLFAQILLLAGMTVGFFLAHYGKIDAHQYNQTTWVLFNIVLTICIMIIRFSEDVISGLPANLQQAYAIVGIIHAVLGSLAIICGVYLLLRMNKLIPKAWRVPWWKNLMRVTLGLYLATGLLGVITYFVWNVFV
jgi:uncharacterized membrane protein YozB (DUF420 family)